MWTDRWRRIAARKSTASLERNEDLAARISDYFAINNMFHDRYDRVLAEPVPEASRGRRGGRRA